MIEAYVAGFLDADGSVGLAKGHTTEMYRAVPEVMFYNADISILETIKKRWGGKIKTRKHTNPKWNTSYEMKLNASQSLSLLKDVYPFMLHGKKRKRAGLILEYYLANTPRNGKYTDLQKTKKLWLVEEVRNIQMRGEGAYS